MKKIIQILILLLVVTCIKTVTAQSQKNRPNFLVILTDDQAYRAIGYNNPYIKTPHLDQLAAQGIIFDKAFTVSPICVASRAALLTGLYPQQNGTVALNTKSFIDAVVQQKKFPTIAQQLRQAGYFTFFAGKSHLGNPLDYGFTAGKESNDFTDSAGFKQVSDLVEQGNLGKQPFFIWLGAKQPHLPLKPQQKWLDLYPPGGLPVDPNFLEQPQPGSLFNQGLPGETLYLNSDYTDNYKGLSAGPPRTVDIMKEFISAYYATVSQLDAQVGALMQQLRQKDLLKNTVVIFLSDNGYFLGNHGLGNKITMHEEAVRVPFFIHWDGLPGKGVRFKGLVANIDLFPTVLDLAGIPVGKSPAGKSFKKILLHQPAAHLHNHYVVSECTGVGGKVGTGHRMVRNERYKYILSDTNEEALYDLEHDPYELQNRIEDTAYTKVLAELKNHLHHWKLQVKDQKLYQ